MATIAALVLNIELGTRRHVKALAGHLNFKCLFCLNSVRKAAKLFDDVTSVFGILQHKKEEELPAEALALLNERAEARKAKNWARADEIREALKALGFAVEEERLDRAESDTQTSYKGRILKYQRKG